MQMARTLTCNQEHVLESFQSRVMSVVEYSLDLISRHGRNRVVCTEVAEQLARMAHAAAAKDTVIHPSFDRSSQDQDENENSSGR